MSRWRIRAPRIESVREKLVPPHGDDKIEGEAMPWTAPSTTSFDRVVTALERAGEAMREFGGKAADALSQVGSVSSTMQEEMAAFVGSLGGDVFTGNPDEIVARFSDRQLELARLHIRLFNVADMPGKMQTAIALQSIGPAYRIEGGWRIDRGGGNNCLLTYAEIDRIREYILAGGQHPLVDGVPEVPASSVRAKAPAPTMARTVTVTDASVMGQAISNNIMVSGTSWHTPLTAQRPPKPDPIHRAPRAKPAQTPPKAKAPAKPAGVRHIEFDEDEE
jgi:hypothetical protein